MAGTHVVNLRADPVDTARGLWCDDCALPSALDITVVISSATSLAPLARM
jgi:hypothetical protein